MTLNDIKTVDLRGISTRGGHGLFILVEIVDKDGNKKLLVRANLSSNTHGDLLSQLRQDIESDDFTLHCVGGGYIELTTDLKRICVYGSSLSFGRESSRQETVHTLQTAFPDFAVAGDS